MMWGPGFGFGYGMGGFGWIFMLLVVGVVVALLLGAYRQVRDDRHGGPVLRPRPRDILDERYARGEIDADEYHRRRADLEHGA